MGRRPVDVLGAEVFDAVTLLAPADEGPVEIGVLRHGLRVLGRRVLGVAPPPERIETPALPAVERLHRRQALQRRLGPDHPRAHQDPAPLGLPLSVARAGDLLSGQAKRPDRREPRRAAAGLQIAREDFVGRQRTRWRRG